MQTEQRAESKSPVAPQLQQQPLRERELLLFPETQAAVNMTDPAGQEPF